MPHSPLAAMVWIAPRAATGRRARVTRFLARSPGRWSRCRRRDRLPCSLPRPSRGRSRQPSSEPAWCGSRMSPIGFPTTRRACLPRRCGSSSPKARGRGATLQGSFSPAAPPIHQRVSLRVRANRCLSRLALPLGVFLAIPRGEPSRKALVGGNLRGRDCAPKV
jgi:hypothetical protein